MQAVRKVSGRVVGQEKYTHDITCLRVRLDDALAYKAGQFANISLEGLPGLSRSYSFASPVQPEAQVQFFVRQVPGGVFSTQVNTANLLGTSVSIEGPQGDFWLRPSDAPLLMVAGGSGLAPILAMLQEALANHTARDVTLLFGARKVQDLYAVDAIEKIRQQWKGTFTFVPVLSDEPVPSEWQGQRGLVTDHLAAVFTQGQHAYLCGPPGMIDSAEAALKKMGIEPADIRADRFITLHEAFTKAA
jgi:3-phenylpropionate/trans-cinnamate dioxygenase ferredoxin reductase subunit